LKTIYHGLYITYIGNGNKIASEKNYKNGKLDGLSKFYDFGKIKNEINYSGGKLNGPYKTYNNGKIESEVNYINDSIKGKYIKYYSNGQIMIEGNKIKNTLEVNKFGFDDGSYVIVQKDGHNAYYQLFSSSGDLIISTKDMDGKFDKQIWCDCPKEQSTIFEYPEKLKNSNLEGIVLLKLLIGIDGKIKKIDPIKGFNDSAIDKTIESVKKINCYGIGLKNDVPVEYELIYPVTYILSDEFAYSKLNYTIKFEKCDK
jgi:hypothetical protein